MSNERVYTLKRRDPTKPTIVCRVCLKVRPRCEAYHLEQAYVCGMCASVISDMVRASEAMHQAKLELEQ